MVIVGQFESVVQLSSHLILVLWYIKCYFHVALFLWIKYRFWKTIKYRHVGKRRYEGKRVDSILKNIYNCVNFMSVIEDMHKHIPL